MQHNFDPSYEFDSFRVQARQIPKLKIDFDQEIALAKESGECLAFENFQNESEASTFTDLYGVLDKKS